MQSRAVRHHEDLRVWHEGTELAKKVYRVSALLPATERFGLTTQMRRAAVSIPANIAEGAARGSSAEFSRFAAIALGSLAELHTHLVLASAFYGIPDDELLNQQIVTLRRKLVSLRAALRRARPAPRV
jgi:four helix bundle protein